MMQIILINAYYNLKERRSFLKQILLPLFTSLKDIDAIEYLFYHASIGRGDHFKILFKLTTNDLTVEKFILDNIDRLIKENPSTTTNDEIRSYFKSFPNNSAHKTFYNSQKIFTPAIEVNAYLEKFVGICSIRTLSYINSFEHAEVLKLSIPLSNAVFNGFDIPIEARIHVIESFLKRFHPTNNPTSIKDKNSRKEIANYLKKLTDGFRKDYHTNKTQYADYLNFSDSYQREWAKEIENCCLEIRNTSIELLQQGNFKLPDDFTYDITSSVSVDQQVLLYVLSLTFSELMNCLLMEDEDLLATACLLNEIYREKIVSQVGVDN